MGSGGDARQERFEKEVTTIEYYQHLLECPRYRIEINGGSQRGGKTRMFESALKAARFISSLGPLAKGERVDVFVCRSLALAVRPQ